MNKHMRAKARQLAAARCPSRGKLLLSGEAAKRGLNPLIDWYECPVHGQHAKCEKKKRG